MTEQRKRQIRGVVLIGLLGLLGGGLVMAYSIYTKLETTLQELQTAYASEQAKTKKLTQKVEELLKAMEQAQAREKALIESRRASEQERDKLKSEGMKLKTSIQQLQAAYATEQAKNYKLTQTAEDLLQVMERVQVQLKVLDEKRRASEQEKDKLKSEGMRLRTAVKQLQTVYAAEQAKTKKLTRTTKELSKTVEQAEAKVQSLEESRKGEMMKVEKLLKLEQEMEGWGKDFHQALRRIFF